MNRVLPPRAALTVLLVAMATFPLGKARAQTVAPPYSASHPLPAPVIFGEGLISTGDDDSSPTFSRDGKTLYFLRNAPDFHHWTVVVSHFQGGRWSEPEIAPFSGQYDDGDVLFTPSEDRLLFISTRPVNGKAKSDTDIWSMKRKGAGWGEPEHVDALASEGNEWFPTMTNSGTIYFGSERRKDNLGPDGTADLYRARWVDGHFTEPENLGPVINTPGNDIEGFIAPDESFLIFSSSGRPDTHGSYDLYVTFNCGGTWSAPQNLGDAVNSKGWEFSPRVTPDGKYLFFTSNRSKLDQVPDRRRTMKEYQRLLHAPGNGLRDIYQVDFAALNLRSPCAAPAH